MELELKSLSKRELQVYGAACLVAFCSANHIVSPHVIELVEHLLLILESKDLPEWDSIGAGLALTGRGDPLPDEVQDLLPEEVAEDFHRLVEMVVEVGMIDMYGGDSEQPQIFLMKSINILKTAGVEVPRLCEVLRHRNKTQVDGWSEPVSREEYLHARQWCLNKLSKAT